ncbi:aminotransferase class IV [Spirosoma luteum]|uniref:aminotransferase class IV n=1 Tax=Spirosoma luteum TaxID=431553 RepID=UPI00036D7D38|nr:aminotransferase class IV [Spirosoma luteum]
MLFCLETICIRNRQLQNLSAHNDRFNRTRLACWQLHKPARLEDVIQLPDWLLPTETYKCRVTYGPAIETIEFEPYHIRPVQRLALVDADGLHYGHKYADRQAINNLFARRDSADDILMVRDGLLTDTSYANVALFDGKRWHTPAKPLLEGTQRARLLADGILHPADIRPADLPQFESIKLMNAMLDWEQTTPIPTQAVR